jgi:hypothetical protein
MSRPSEEDNNIRVTPKKRPFLDEPFRSHGPASTSVVDSSDGERSDLYPYLDHDMKGKRVFLSAKDFCQVILDLSSEWATDEEFMKEVNNVRNDTDYAAAVGGYFKVLSDEKVVESDLYEWVATIRNAVTGAQTIHLS